MNYVNPVFNQIIPLNRHGSTSSEEELFGQPLLSSTPKIDSTNNTNNTNNLPHTVSTISSEENYFHPINDSNTSVKQVICSNNQTSTSNTKTIDQTKSHGYNLRSKSKK